MADLNKNMLSDDELEQISGGKTVLTGFSTEELAQIMAINFKFDPGDQVLVKNYENFDCFIMTRVRSLDGPKYKIKVPEIMHGWITARDEDITLVAKGGGVF